MIHCKLRSSGRSRGLVARYRDKIRAGAIEVQLALCSAGPWRGTRGVVHVRPAAERDARRSRVLERILT